MRILPAVPVDTHPRTPFISFCTVQLLTFCSFATLCLFTASGPGPGELPSFWGSMVFRHAPIPRKGSGKQQQSRTLVSKRGMRAGAWGKRSGLHSKERRVLRRRGSASTEKLPRRRVHEKEMSIALHKDSESRRKRQSHPYELTEN